MGLRPRDPHTCRALLGRLCVSLTLLSAGGPFISQCDSGNCCLSIRRHTPGTLASSVWAGTETCLCLGSGISWRSSFHFSPGITSKGALVCLAASSQGHCPFPSRDVSPSCCSPGTNPPQGRLFLPGFPACWVPLLPPPFPRSRENSHSGCVCTLCRTAWLARGGRQRPASCLTRRPGLRSLLLAVAGLFLRQR